MKVYNVLEIYRITLLSNYIIDDYAREQVLEIYRITLLSNLGVDDGKQQVVLEIYRITLLSNPKLNLRLNSNSGYHQV